MKREISAIAAIGAFLIFIVAIVAFVLIGKKVSSLNPGDVYTNRKEIGGNSVLCVYQVPEKGENSLVSCNLTDMNDEKFIASLFDRHGNLNK